MRKDLDHLPPLDLLLAFEAAARHLSFTRAADERFVTQSAISRQIRSLEDDLGVELFARGHRTLALTAPGQKLLLACQSVLAQLRRTVSGIRAPNAREVLALSTTPSFASYWLIPRLRSFTQANPGVDVRLDASYEVRDLQGEGFDIAVRYQRANASDGERLFNETMLPVCAPSLRRSRDAPLKVPADLRHHTLIEVEGMSGGGAPVEWSSWLQANGVPDLEPRSRLTFSSYNEVVAAAVAGQGVGLGRRPLLDGLLRSKQLVAPFGDAKETARAYFVLIDPASRARPAVRALEEWLREQAEGA
jgi:LysR family transcriptional regulator, glycine cleavage system transcriptional activator